MASDWLVAQQPANQKSYHKIKKTNMDFNMEMSFWRKFHYWLHWKSSSNATSDKNIINAIFLSVDMLR